LSVRGRQSLQPVESFPAGQDPRPPATQLVDNPSGQTQPKLILRIPIASALEAMVSSKQTTEIDKKLLTVSLKYRCGS
jgi:hypothetical protein